MNKSINSVLYITLLLIIWAIYTLISYITPPQLDDLAFMALYHNYSGESDEFSLYAIRQFFSEMRQYDNSRLANLLSIFSTIIFPWNHIFPFITGLATAAIVALSVAICRISKDRWKYAVIMWLMIILFLPWRNNIIVADYALNYIYASAITLLFIYITVIKRHLIKKPAVFLLAVVVAILSGVWHEGFTAPTLAGIGALCILKKFRMNRQWYAIVLINFFAFAFITFCPGVLSRFDREAASQFEVLDFKVFFDLAPVILLLLNLIILSTYRKGRKIITKSFHNDIFITIFITTLTGTLISLLITHTPRTSFWPSLCGIISLVILNRKQLESLMCSRLSIPVVLTTLTLCCMQSILTIIHQNKFYSEYNTIMKMFREADSPTVFYDVIMPEDISILTLYFPARISWVTGFHFHCLSLALNRQNAAVIPTALRHTPQQPDTLSNPESEFTIRRSGNALFTDWIHNLAITSVSHTRVKIQGSTMDTDALILNFTTEDGDSLAYIKPYKVTIDRIDSIEILSYQTLHDNQ